MGYSVRSAVALVAGATALVQATAQIPQFRAAVELVRLEVSVLDGDGRPVRGLPADAFTVLDDGRPQRLDVFTAIESEAAPDSAASWVRDGLADIESNAPAAPGASVEGRLFVLLIDDLLLPPDPAMLENAKRIGRSIVERVGRADRMAVVFTSGASGAQNFTSDRRKLMAAIDAARVGSAAHTLGWETAVPLNPMRPDDRLAPATDPDMGLRLAALKTLQMVAGTLSAIPHGRRAVFLVSPGITVDNESEAQPVRIGGSAPGGVAIRETNRQLVRGTADVLREMAAANVTVYSIDPCGLGGLESYVLDAARRLGSLRNAVSLPSFYNWLAPDAAPPASELARHVATLDKDFLQTAAEQTGGRAVVNTNAFDEGLDQIFEENSSYYVLGYAEPRERAPGAIRRVTVKVDRPGVRVRHRTSVVTRAASAEVPENAQAAVSAALNGPMPHPELPMTVSLAPVATSDPEKSAITIVFALSQPPVRERTRQSIDFATAVFTADGQSVVPAAHQTLAFTMVPTGAAELFEYEVLTHVAVPPGRYEVRVAAHRETDGKTGSVYADVEVPRFTAAPLAASGVWLESSTRPVPLPRNALAALIPVVPTTRREFQRRETATAMLRFYQSGASPLAPLTVRSRIVDERETDVLSTETVIDAAQFDAASKSAEHRLALPLQSLAPGRYLLRFEARNGPTLVHRDIVFRVRP